MRCPGVGTSLLVRPRPDGGDEPLPCPVCLQHVPNGVVQEQRVYLNHEGIA